MSAKTTEQLSHETTVLFDKLEQHNTALQAISIQIAELKGQVTSLITVSERVLNNTPSNVECSAKHERIREDIARIERDMVEGRKCSVSRVELDNFISELKGLKAFLTRLGLIVATALVGLGVYNIFGGPPC